MINNNSLENGGMEERLWEYIDGFIDFSERQAIEKLISENAEWKTRYHQLLEIHEAMNLEELDHPSLRFSKNVMEEIAKHSIAPAAKTYINNKIIWAISIFFITLFFGFLIYGLVQIDWSVPDNSKKTWSIDLNKIDYNKIFNNNFVTIFMMLNIVLGLLLLDSYLNKKKKEFVKKA